MGVRDPTGSAPQIRTPTSLVALRAPHDTSPTSWGEGRAPRHPPGSNANGFYRSSKLRSAVRTFSQPVRIMAVASSLFSVPSIRATIASPPAPRA